MANNNYITASEIGDYVYCKRAWWLKTRGVNQTTTQTVAGINAHESLAKFLRLSFKIKIIAFLLIGIGFLGLILIGVYIF